MEFSFNLNKFAVFVAVFLFEIKGRAFIFSSASRTIDIFVSFFE